MYTYRWESFLDTDSADWEAGTDFETVLLISLSASGAAMSAWPMSWLPTVLLEDASAVDVDPVEVSVSVRSDKGDSEAAIWFLRIPVPWSANINEYYVRLRKREIEPCTCLSHFGIFQQPYRGKESVAAIMIAKRTIWRKKQKVQFYTTTFCGEVWLLMIVSRLKRDLTVSEIHVDWLVK